MLEDFIEVGNVPAEIIHKRIPVSMVRCVLLLPKNQKKLPVLAVVPVRKRISLKKIIENTDYSELRPATKEETNKITGYRKKFLPPISIYGVKVLIDKSLLKKEHLNILINEKTTLQISPDTIIEFNEEPVKTIDLLEEK